MKKRDSLLRGATIISLGAVLTKLIGALYRVPLTRLIGAEGLGIYQMVFPFYCILLTLSSTGIPTALSKIIAEGTNPKKVLYKSIIAFGALGLIGSLTMILLAGPISDAQGNTECYAAYIALSPSVFIVSIISCFRGYFQGQQSMLPTAASQIIEQLVKLAFSLGLLLLIPLMPAKQAMLACLAVTVSEIFALLYLITKFSKADCLSIGVKETGTLKMFAIVIPVAISAALLPLSRVFDSFVVINLLPLNNVAATMQYGIYSGGVESLIGVPVAVCYGLAVSVVPLLAGDKNNKKLIVKLINYTVILSLLAVFVTTIFAKTIVAILYGGLTVEQQQLMAGLLKLSAVQILLLSLLQSQNSALIACDMQNIPPISLIISIGVKIFAVIMLVPNPSFGIFGLAISDIFFFATAVGLNGLFLLSRGARPKSLSSIRIKNAV